MKTLFLTRALYNRWANERLYAELLKLTLPQLAASTAVNFGSIIAIANHVVLADRLWLNRFTADGDPVPSVDAVPYPELPRLSDARRAEEERTIDFIRDLDPARLTQVLSFTTTDGTPMVMPFTLCLDHFFNHQTHHRGQIHGMLGAFGIKAADIDLLGFERERHTYASLTRCP
jgi:uncharacterized damage-inducible protein DinB